MPDDSDGQRELSSERQFLENLINTRANFALIIFALAVTAASSMDNRLVQTGLLLASTALALILALATAHAQWKLELTLESLPDVHPARKIAADAEKKARSLSCFRRWYYGVSRRAWIGFAVPGIAAGLLLLGAILAADGALANGGPHAAPSQAEVAALTERVSGETTRIDSMRAGLVHELTTLRVEVASVRDSLRVLRAAIALDTVDATDRSARSGPRSPSRAPF